MLCAKTSLTEITGVEIQKKVFEMAKRSIVLNNLENKFKIINSNVKDIDKILECNYFDVVVTNPPYKKMQTGRLNENENKLISRHEVEACLDDFINISSKMLKSKGEFYMVHRPDRLVDVIEALRKYKLEPKEIRFVHPNKDKAPNIILIKAVKNAKPFLKVMEPLYVYDIDGSYTEEILKIYNKNI